MKGCSTRKGKVSRKVNDECLDYIVQDPDVDVVPHSKSGIFPRSSLLGAGLLGFWEFGEGGTVG